MSGYSVVLVPNGQNGLELDDAKELQRAGIGVKLAGTTLDDP